MEGVESPWPSLFPPGTETDQRTRRTGVSPTRWRERVQYNRISGRKIKSFQSPPSVRGFGALGPPITLPVTNEEILRVNVRDCATKPSDGALFRERAEQRNAKTTRQDRGAFDGSQTRMLSTVGIRN